MHKHTLRLSLFLAALLALPVVAAPRGCLHVVYVTNRDREALPGYRERIHRIMKDMQDFYRTEMARNGYGPKTFKLDLDKNANVVVHLVTLDWDFDPERKFTPQELRPIIAEHLRKKGIDVEREQIITFLNAYWKNGNTWEYNVVYTGSGNPVKGATWVVDHVLLDPENIDPARKEIVHDRGQRLTLGQFNVKMIGGVAHEFGHGLGLPHNKETKEESESRGTAIMGAGNYAYRQERLGKRPHGAFLTPAHAFILSLHPLFNGRVPADFEVPDVFIENLEFEIRKGFLEVSGKVVPSPGFAGVVLYHDPLPTGINKDYDAYSYLAEKGINGKFSAKVPTLAAAECALHLKVYFKNGMHQTFSFIQRGDGLESLRNGYLLEQAKYAFKHKDSATLRRLVAQLEKADPKAARQARRFLSVAEQWKDFKVPSEIYSRTTKQSLSSTRWDTASVGWYIPSFNGVIDPKGKWFRQLRTQNGICPEGLYAHAPSNYTYDLGRRWKKLETRIGIHKGKEGSVVFIIKGDGKELFRSPVITPADGEVPVEINIARVKTLELITDAGNNGTSSDWGIWIAPVLRR